MICIACALLSSAAFLAWLMRPDGSTDTVSWSRCLHRAWRRVAFWAGDVHFSWQWYWFLPLPNISWTHHECAVKYEELLEALKLVRQGDVLLTTKRGYWFSNSAIPGVFKHAAIIVESCEKGIAADNGELVRVTDVSAVRLVEAVSEGVVLRHPLWARADLMIVVRPMLVSEEDRKQAARTALKLVGHAYDASFDFNIEEELSRLGDASRGPSREMEEDKRELQRLEQNRRAQFDMAFSCTETVAAAWWFRRRRLGIVRRKVRGRMCITADQFISRDFKIVWTNVSLKQARRAGLGEEGLREFEMYEC